MQKHRGWLMALVAGLTIGGLVGYALAPSSTPDHPDPPTIERTSETHTRTEPGAPLPDEKASKENTPEKKAAPAGPCADAQSTARALKREVQTLQRQLAFERALREDIEGAPVPFPNKLPARFLEDAFVSQIKASLAETGIDGVVEHVDCEEYPCIVYGTISSDISSEAALADLRLLHEDAHKAYKGDDFYISHTTQESQDGGDPMVVFNISYYPPDPPEGVGEDVGKRMKFRKDRYYDALR